MYKKQSSSEVQTALRETGAWKGKISSKEKRNKYRRVELSAKALHNGLFGIYNDTNSEFFMEVSR